MNRRENTQSKIKMLKKPIPKHLCSHCIDLEKPYNERMLEPLQPAQNYVTLSCKVEMYGNRMERETERQSNLVHTKTANVYMSEISEKRPHKWSYAFRILAHITDKVDFEIVCFSFRFFFFVPFFAHLCGCSVSFLFWFIRFAVYK